MSGPIESAVVVYRGRTRPLDDEAALELIDHAEAYDPPAAYSSQMSTLPGPDAGREDHVGSARVFWGDGVPSTFDATEADPTAFVVDHEDGRVRVSFSATPETLSDVDDALAHLFEREPLETDLLEARVVDAEVGVDAVDLPGEDDLPGEEFVLSMTGGRDRTAVELSSDGLLADRTTTFSVREAFDGLETLVDRVEDAGTPVEGTALHLHGRTDAVDADRAAEILDRVRAFEPPEGWRSAAPAETDADATGSESGGAHDGGIDPVALSDSGLEWADPSFGVESTVNRVVHGVDPNALYVGYDADDGRVSVAACVEGDAAGVVDDLLAHVYEVAQLEPTTVWADLDTGEAAVPDVAAPPGLELTVADRVEPEEGAVVEDTAATFSLTDRFGPAVEAVLEQVGQAADAGVGTGAGADVADPDPEFGVDDDGHDWDRIADLRADLKPAGEEPTGPVETFTAGMASDDEAAAIAAVTAAAHGDGVWSESSLRSLDSLEVADGDPMEIETSVVERSVTPDGVDDVVSEYDTLDWKTAFLEMSEEAAALADLADREDVAVVEVEFPETDDPADQFLVATEDGE